jgi:hypothetical protein
MPRQSRIASPGALHHVMIRGSGGQRFFETNIIAGPFSIRSEESYGRGDVWEMVTFCDI